MKKKTKLLSLISTTLAGLALSLGVVGVAKKDSIETHAYYTPSTHYEVSDTASELESYYSSISDSDTGTSLLSKLQSLNSSKRKKTIGYSGIGTDTSGAVIYTDYDLNNTAKDSNGQTYGTKVASFYTKTSATSWNREHMWPNSHGGNNVEADILHTRPTISSENSSRGNSFYVEGKNNSSSGWDPYTAGYEEWVRGECARVILYCVVAYPSFTLSDADSHSTSNSNKDNMMGNMNTLIKWHFNYQPNVYEKNRNDGAEYLQGNRNPFVDHPEYVAKIWSNFNSTVSSLCSSNSSTYSNWIPGNYCSYGTNTPVQAAEGVTISASTASVSVGSTTTLSATSTDSGAITWTTSNSSVASLSSSSAASGANVTITGVAAGTATITAKRTINGTQYSQTCTVTVTKVVSSLSKGSTSPTKTTYTAGESFDPTGLTITATYSDSTQGNVTSSVVWSPDPLTAGTTSVTGTYGGKSITITGLTVNEAAQPESYSIVPSDLANGTYPTSATSYTAASGISVTAMNTANFSSKIQFKKSGGYLYNNSSLNLGTLTLSGISGSLTVYAGTSKNPSSTTISGSNGVYDLSGYNYFKIINNSGSVATCSSISVGLAQQAKTLSSISVYESPDKLSYTAGEYFDPTGLEITRTYSDGTEDNYSYADHTSEFTFNPTTSTALTTSNETVTITYGGQSCEQGITVSAAKTLSSISVSTAPTKTTYTAGEYFDPTGLVITRNYSDSTSDTYTYSGHTSEFTFSPSTSTALTTSNVSVSITYGGKSCNQAITVNAAQQKTLSSIAVQTAPTKTTYVVDEYFDPTGLVITRNYSDSTSDTYTYANHTSEFTFNPSTSTALTTSNVSVTITYGGKSCNQAITVNTSGGGGSSSDGDAELYSGTITEGYYVIYYDGKAMNSTVSSERLSYTSVTPSNDVISEPDASIVWHIEPNGNYWTLFNEDANAYAAGTGAKNKAQMLSDGTDDKSLWTITGDSTYEFVNKANTSAGVNANLRENGTYGYACYSTSTGGALSLYRINDSSSVEPITSISATVSKTFYVGESISKSDITVKDSNNSTISSSNFSFTNDGYQFTYSDAASGGASTSKTFTNAISYSTFTCSLTVNVSRKAYFTPNSTSISLVSSSLFSEIGGENSNLVSGTVSNDGITYEYYKAYYYSSGSAISFGNASSQVGYLTNQTPLNSGITDVTVTSSGRTVNVRYSVDGSTWVTKASADTTNNTYQYFKVDCIGVSGSSYSNITQVAITTKGETANNISNYIMYEDTNNQCVSKLPTALGYYKNLSDSGKTEFQTSEEYVISTARTRLEAWALSQGKTIDYSTGNLINKSNVVTFGLADGDTSMTLIIIVSGMSILSLSVLLVIKKKRLHN